MFTQAALAHLRQLQARHELVVAWYNKTFVGSNDSNLSPDEWLVLVAEVEHRQLKEGCRMDDLCADWHSFFPALVEEVEQLRAYQKERVNTWAKAVCDAVSGWTYPAVATC